MEHEKKVGERVDADIVCFRGLMTKVGVRPFKPSFTWITLLDIGVDDTIRI